MVLDLKFSKFDDTPWGFRLTGGADFAFPLTVIKVTEKSLSEEAGLKFGDIVVRVNDIPTSNLSHLEAHNVLLAAGNNFTIGVIRDQTEYSDLQNSLNENNNEDHEIEDEIKVQPIVITQNNAENVKPEDTVEDKIAELMSSEAEVLPDHNVIGINFNKIIPPANLIKESEVFKTLNKEAIKTPKDKQEEERKWTTFLQKPNRPIPKSKFEIAMEKREQYKVKIVKQPKPRIAPDRETTPQPISEPESPTQEPEIQEEIVEETKEASKSSELKQLSETEMEEIVKETEDNEVPDLKPEEQIVEEEPTNGIPTELEHQLADVQRQLMALSNLPQAIQETLDAVTYELAKIVPAVRQSQSISEERDNHRSKSPSREIEIRPDSTAEVIVEFCTETPVETPMEEISNPLDDNESVQDLQSPEITEDQNLEPKELENEQQRKLEQMKINQENEQEEETRQRNESKRYPGKLPKNLSVFGPLVPQERPVYLPGGRKWRNAKDAYNDQFIAEILSSQAELITGSTLGVNFLKYKKPEKKVDLKNSEVYRMIHHMDREPQTGIAVRAEKVVTEEDVKRSVAPVTPRGQ